MATAFSDVKPFPSSAPAAVGSKTGHNRPLPAADVLREFQDLLAQREGFHARVEQLIGAAERATATNDDTAGRCGELVKQIAAAEKVIDAAHVSAKAPYLEATRAIDGAKNETKAPLIAAKEAVNGKLTVYLREQEAVRRAEQRRLDDERRAREVEQRQREEEARRLNQPAPEPEPVYEAPAPTPEPTRIRGDFGALTSARKEWKVEVLDYDAAFAAVSNNAKVREAIDAAVKSLVRGGVREIAGVRIFEDVKAQVR